MVGHALDMQPSRTGSPTAEQLALPGQTNLLLRKGINLLNLAADNADAGVGRCAAAL